MNMHKLLSWNGKGRVFLMQTKGRKKGVEKREDVSKLVE
jgi:hypothetical protein